MCAFLSTSLLLAQDGTGCKLNYPVNDSLHDYAPVVFYTTGGNDTLFFTSNRFVTQKAFEKDMRAEMWIATRPSSDRESGKPPYRNWTVVSNLSQFVSATDYQFPTFTRGTMAFDKSRNTIIFAAERALVLDSISTSIYTIESGKNTSYLLDLWFTTDNFATMHPLRAVNSEAWDSQPTLTPDGNTLFFTSTRPTEIGGVRDSSKNIFYSRRASDGTWLEAQLVPLINTPGDEISPHCGADGNFYYASSWKDGRRADHDIYRTDFDLRTRLPINSIRLDEALAGCVATECPYNTPANDCFPFVTPDKKTIFFTSDRDKGKYDIYAVNLPEAALQLEVIVQKTNNCCETPTPVQTQLTLNDGTKDTTIQSETPVRLQKNMIYTISASGSDKHEVNTYNIATSCKDTTLRYTIHIHEKKSIPAVVLRDTIGVPYFITGYWWPNTSVNYSRYLRDSQSGLLNPSAPFIEHKPDQYNYTTITSTITSVFEKDVCGTIRNLMRNPETSCCVILVTVHGYTDPRRLLPGQYSGDEDVTVGGIIIPKGQDMQARFAMDVSGKRIDLPRDERRIRKDSIPYINPRGQQGNIFLSKLRAHFTMETIIQMMKNSPDSAVFNSLFSNNQIQFEADGFGIFDSYGKDKELASLSSYSNDRNNYYTGSSLEKNDIPDSRRIIIFFDIVSRDEVRSFQRVRGGKIQTKK